MTAPSPDRPVHALWRRLDVPGHDSCELVKMPDGYLLEGVALFLDARGPARIDYAVECDVAWGSRRGHLRATIGTARAEMRIQREASGEWSLNGALVPGLGDCLDLDFGFTPATNLLQTRRIALAIGASADVPAAWIEPPARSLVRLPQRYQRIGALAYRYDAPTSNYSETLEMDPSGFVRHYPGLWVLEAG